MGEQTILLQGLIARLQKGDSEARLELIRCAYERLRRLAAVILNESFPRLKKAPTMLDTTDLLNETALKLHDALAEVQPATVQDFLRLAAQRMRLPLLDLAKRADHAEEQKRTIALPENAGPDSSVTSVSATLGALYRQVEELPPNEREVVDLLYFHGLSQAEAAAILGIAERTVRRHWTAAKIKLFEGLKDYLPGVVPVAE